MSGEKLSSDEVPGKFTEWLLAMGCPPEKVASEGNIAEMCRGQYYMVWRCLMEQVEAKDVIRNKRLQVFCNDIKKSQKKNILCKSDSTAMPGQLSLWREQAELQRKVEEAQARVALAQKDLQQISDKVSNKICQRDVSRRRVTATARRADLLRQLATSLTDKIDNLRETRTIADSLCQTHDDGDIQAKLDKCISSYRRQTATNGGSFSVSNTTTGSVNGDSDFEEQVWQLVKSRGDALCTALCSRRAQLVTALGAHTATTSRDKHNKCTPQSVLARTAALHCTLSLEATKNKLHLQQARKRLLDALTDINNYLTTEACELLVLRCERTSVEARVSTLRAVLDDVINGSDVFHVTSQTAGAGGRGIAAVDKAIECKKEELKRVIAALSHTDRKIESVRECLAAVFAGFGRCTPVLPNQYRGIQLDLPSESISALQEFYTSRRAARANKMDVSLDLEVSDNSFNIDSNNARFVDELKIYLKKFNLEQNRQLVLESGEKIWIFETVKHSIERLHKQWLSDDLSCALLNPSAVLNTNIMELVSKIRSRDELAAVLATLDVGVRVPDIVITEYKKEEEQIVDRTKKRLRESILDLQKASKTFAIGQEDLKLWSNNDTKKYISTDRKVGNLTYKDYENYYIENCLNV